MRAMRLLKRNTRWRLAALLFQPGCCFLGGLVGGDVGVDGLLSEFLAGAGDILRHGDDE